MLRSAFLAFAFALARALVLAGFRARQRQCPGKGLLNTQQALLVQLMAKTMAGFIKINNRGEIRNIGHTRRPMTSQLQGSFASGLDVNQQPLAG